MRSRKEPSLVNTLVGFGVLLEEPGLDDGVEEKEDKATGGTGIE